ncbi:MAG: hypothetical protein QM278_04680 [Pseudomonadota bacterium]|nr:hypothetical protein [Pseudomonadota bacterium]
MARLKRLVAANLCRRAGIGKVPEIIGGIDDGQKVLPPEITPSLPCGPGWKWPSFIPVKLALFLAGDDP